MKRIALIVGLLTWLSPTWTAVVRGQDVVKVVDPKTGKGQDLSGAIQEESPAGIKLKQGQVIKLIPALDITHVVYRMPDNTAARDYDLYFRREKSALDKAKPADRRAALADVKLDFEKLADKVRDSTTAYRYVQYRLALLQVHLAHEDASKRDTAIDALNRFRNENSAGWEIVPCLKTLAQLQEEAGDIAGATKSYQELRVVPDVSKELKMESDILIASMLMRGKKYAEAEDALRKLNTSLPDSDPQKPTIVVYLCQAQLMQNKTQDFEKQIASALHSTSDAPTLALAHNALGDYFRKKNQDEDAFWHYLRVDVLYPANKEEHAKALYWLSKLFESVKKDKPKAQECVEKLKSKDLEATEYARRLAAEK